MSQANFQYALQLKRSVYKSYLETIQFVPGSDPNGRKTEVPLPLSSNILDRMVVVPYNPQIQPPTNILTSGSSTYTDFYIQNYDAILLDYIIEINCAETGGSNSVTPVPSELMINYSSLYANTGSLEIQRLYGDQLWQNLGLLSSDQLSQLAPVINQNTMWGNPQAISASGTARYYILSIGNCCPYVRFYMPSINNYLQLRVNWNGNGVDSGSGTLQVSSVKLHCIFLDLPPADKVALRNFYASNTVEAHILTNVNMPLSQTLNASTFYNFILSSFQGEEAGIFMWFRSSKTGSGLRTLAYPGNSANYQFADANNNPILDPSPINGDFLRYILTYNKFAGQFFSIIPVVPIQFDNNLTDAILYGKSNGLYFGTTKEQLSFNLPATWSSSTWYLDLYLLTWQHLHIRPDGLMELYLPG
jgi:hypothetical protein